MVALRASAGSTERASAQSTSVCANRRAHDASVSSSRRAYEAADQYLRAVFLIPDLS
jgi:hypothetical protein